MATASISDYEGFDFASLWHRRERVTEVEQRFLVAALAGADRRRVLELGAGFGRLTPTLARIGGEVVATDFDRGSLERMRTAEGSAPRFVRIAANLYHLPFVDGAFPAATMVRVYHHLDDPVAALSELRRVLAPGGQVLVSYNPKPSVGTLVNDIQRALRPTAEFRSITFSRERHLELPPDPFPVHVGPRAEFADVVRSAGFAIASERVSGLEEYYLMRFVPAEVFVRVGTALGRAPGFPMRFALLRAPGAPPGRLVPASELLACPRCRAPVAGTEAGAACSSCGFFGEARDGVLDLRYVPDGATRWRGAGHAR